METVANLFDHNNGLIDWKEFIAALRPDWEERTKPPTEAEKIHDEVKRLVMLCTCRQKFRVFQVGEGKYRVSVPEDDRVRRPMSDRLFLSPSSATARNSDWCASSGRR